MSWVSNFDVDRQRRRSKLSQSMASLHAALLPHSKKSHGATTSTLPKPTKTSLQSTRPLDPTANVDMVQEASAASFCLNHNYHPSRGSILRFGAWPAILLGNRWVSKAREKHTYPTYPHGAKPFSHCTFFEAIEKINGLDLRSC